MRNVIAIPSIAPRRSDSTMTSADRMRNGARAKPMSTARKSTSTKDNPSR